MAAPSGMVTAAKSHRVLGHAPLGGDLCAVTKHHAYGKARSGQLNTALKDLPNSQTLQADAAGSAQ